MIILSYILPIFLFVGVFYVFLCSLDYQSITTLSISKMLTSNWN